MESKEQSVDISKVIKKLQDRLSEALLTIAILEVKIEDLMSPVSSSAE